MVVIGFDWLEEKHASFGEVLEVDAALEYEVLTT